MQTGPAGATGLPHGKIGIGAEGDPMQTCRLYLLTPSTPVGDEVGVKEREEKAGKRQLRCGIVNVHFYTYIES